MHIIVTVDDRWGTRFNHRRQSRDRVLTGRILELSAQAALWIDESSGRLFPDAPANLKVDPAFPEKAAPGDFCFVEDMSLLPGEDRIEDIFVFHWNRHYPADQFFDRGILERGWTLAQTSEFAGHSHEKITEERYMRTPAD